MKYKTRICLAILASVFSACWTRQVDRSIFNKISGSNTSAFVEELSQQFSVPPDSIQTSVYWYWMSDNISKEGVKKDLQAMKKVGINRAFIGNIGIAETPYGKTKLFSEEWWDITHTALKTATELGIEIGIFNSPGWSQSGGPWVRSTQTMRYLGSTETQVKGGKNVSIELKKPAGDFQDVKVIAFPAPTNYNDMLTKHRYEVLAIPEIAGLKNITDNIDSTGINFPAGNSVDIYFKTSEPYTARSLTVLPLRRPMYAEAELQVRENNDFRTVKKFTIDRTNVNLITGFNPYGPIVVSIPETKATEFRLLFSSYSLRAGVSEIVISSSPKVESFIEKTLAKMHPTPLPLWKEYQWPVQSEVRQTDMLIDPSSVLDISEHMKADGHLNWDAPPGEWVVMRTGMLPTGVLNNPASPEGTGLEIDKMNAQHVGSHFDAFLGEIIRRIPAADRKSWKVVVADSYEKGGQNWTDDFLERFRSRYGYSALSFLPVLQGKVVGSQNLSDRFLWDLRRLIADNVAYEYVGGLREAVHRNGLTVWLENYGHWGFPAEFLQYGGQSDEVAGEFWSEGKLGNIENRAASSAAHIYGKTKVSAESFTSGGKLYARYPLLMKQRGDRFFTEGINNTLLHLFIQQPDDTKVPGINAAFGNEFNRLNTWFHHTDLFIQYLKRCNLMLQQGKYVADVAYFIGEDVPKMTGVCDPPLPAGYSFDYINAEVILNRMTVKEGNLYLPDGMQYRMLVLPKLETIRPELLIKIKELVNAGGIVLGPKPNRSPSLENYPEADKKVQEIAADLWRRNGVRGAGKGLVLSGMDMKQVFESIKLIPDCKIPETDSALFIHRRALDTDIYFISNQSSKAVIINPEFRVSGKCPEWWDAITGTRRALPAYKDNGASTVVPMQLEPLQSAFIVFRKPGVPAAKANSVPENFPPFRTILELAGSWKVDFLDKVRGPEHAVQFDKLVDWTYRSEEKVKYYSGTAVYSKAFSLKKQEGQRIFMDLGRVAAMAKVRINGKDAGGVWTYPYRVDITNAVKEGTNELEIEVVNTWVNRLIGDSKLPVDQRTTWTSFPIYKPESPLQESGLLGPVIIQTVEYK